jgi:hypothetical protein
VSVCLSVCLSTIGGACVVGQPGCLDGHDGVDDDDELMIDDDNDDRSRRTLLNVMRRDLPADE